VRLLPACLVQVVLVLLVSGPAAQSSFDEIGLELDKRVHVFSQHVRCLVCQNETLADSSADLADDLRREIRAQMKAGKSDEQITAFLTERYGDFVLYRPPFGPSTYPLWFGPFVLAAGGLSALYRFVKGPAASSGSRPTPAAVDRRRARQLLEAHDRGEIG
jgi:cytochrome c-type biogenesis protein CcmH